MMAERCIACGNSVSRRQQSLRCNNCRQLQHRTCDTGFSRQAKLLIIGLDNAGKSTLLDRLSSGRLVQNPPTWQSRSAQLDLGNISFTAYDLGGHPQVRRVWRDYLPAIDGVVFIVDTADQARFPEARVEIESLLRDEIIPDTPIAVLFNKVDRKDSVGEEYLVNELGLGTVRTGKAHVAVESLTSRPLETFPCSVLKQHGYGEAFRWLGFYVK